MTRGKKTCKILKEIRQQIADKNNIEYITSECHFQGECQGTCPKCEEEVRYLENELNKRRQLGKAVAIAGISLGVAGAFSACSTSKQNLHQNEPILQVLEGDVIGRESFFASIEEIDTVVKEIEFFNEHVDGEIVAPFAEIMPEYPGGMEALYSFLRQNLVPSEKAKKQGIEGTLLVEFVVTETGKIGDIKVIIPLHPEYEKEAIRVIKEMPNWKPAEQNGKAVAVTFRLPIMFSFNDEK